MYENILKLAELQDGGELSPTTEEAIALAYADRHWLELRYVAAWSRWLSHDGACWNIDDTLHAFDRARDICREVALECEKSGTASTIASAKTVAAVVRLASADRRLAATVAQWDSNALLFNTGTETAATYDLRTGIGRTPDPLDYITKKPLVTWRRRARRIRYGGRSSFASPAGIPSCSNFFSATSAIVARDLPPSIRLFSPTALALTAKARS